MFRVVMEEVRMKDRTMIMRFSFGRIRCNNSPSGQRVIIDSTADTDVLMANKFAHSH